MRTETMIAGAVVAASAYNTWATVRTWRFGGGGPTPEEVANNNLFPHLPASDPDLFTTVVFIGLGAAVAFVWLGVEDLATAARENPHRRFEPLKPHGR